MIKKIIEWLIMRKVKDEAGKMVAAGVSITKLCAVLIGVLQATELASPYFGHPIKIDPRIYGAVASLGGIALKEGVDRSAPVAPKP